MVANRVISSKEVILHMLSKELQLLVVLLQDQ